MTTTSRRPRTPPKAPAKRKAPARKPPKPPAEAPESTAAPKPPAPKSPASKKTASKAKAVPKAKAAPKIKAAPKTKAAPKAKAAPKVKSTPKAKAAPKVKGAPKAAAEVAPRRSAQSPPRTPFILLIVGLLGGALVSLLLLNTVLAKDAFTLTRLQQSSERLEERQQELELDIAKERSPEKIADLAKRLGMKPNEVPVFFDTDTGRTRGSPRQVGGVLAVLVQA
ncbi:hypothetical protein, partial [Actinomadura sp. LOL_011]|uniref:hypothetical protein n=1 Tax=Actinomadura sp. LOL_011 TaxID=3345410 RepID=UPI003A7F8BBC